MFFIKLTIKLLNLIDYFQQKKIIKLINKKFLEPIIIFDVGAHYGETINIFKKKIKYKKIYSFESSPRNFEILKKKFYKKKIGNIEIFNYALGDKKSKKYINQTLESSSSTINQINFNSKYLSKKLKILNIKNKNLFIKKIPIEVITIDEFIEDNKINKIDLLKLDTEGYEYNILKGLSKNFNKVKLVYFEHHYDDMILKEYKFGDIHNLLHRNGFKMIKKYKMFFRKSFEYVYENKN